MRTPVRAPMTVALVTGAASGIGAAVAERLVELGVCVLRTDRSAEAFTGQHRGIGLDVRVAEQWDDALRTALHLGGGGPVDLLVVNSAGLSLASPILSQEAESVRNLVEVNLFGAIHAVTCSARMVLGEDAVEQLAVVNVCSFAGVTAVPGLAVYSAVKHAVRGYSLSADQELGGARRFVARRPGRQRVSVTVAGIDGVATAMLRAQLDQPEAATAFSAPRLLQPREVALVLCHRVLRRGRLRANPPPELLIPRRRGLVMKIGSLWPRLGAVGGRRLHRIGLRHQEQLRSNWSASDNLAAGAAVAIDLDLRRTP